MIRYQLSTPRDELAADDEPATATVTLSTDDPDDIVTVLYDGDPELVRRIRAHLRMSHGTRGCLGIEKTCPRDLNHAIHISRQLDDYDPVCAVDTVRWGDEGG